MNGANRQVNAKVVAVVGLMLVAAGCSTMGPLRGGDLPRGAKVVGGGFQIDWEAPTAGTAYLVEETSGKIITTESLDEDETFEFQADLSDADMMAVFEQVTGVDIETARLVLYFKPSPAEE